MVFRYLCVVNHKQKTCTMSNLTLTELEDQILQALIGQLYAEPGFSDVDANDLANATGISTKIIRGALSSLIKKGVVTIETGDFGYQLIHLLPKYWHLHPRWKDETAEQ